jgi:superfamily II DNA/RNA helicase
MSTLFGRKRGRHNNNPTQLRSDASLEAKNDGSELTTGLRQGNDIDDDGAATNSSGATKKIRGAGRGSGGDDPHGEASAVGSSSDDMNRPSEAYQSSKQQPPPPPPSGPPLIIPSNSLSSLATFADLGLSEPLVATCRSLGFKRPTPVQRHVIPFLLHNPGSSHLLALAATGSGKTAAFVLPILQHLSLDPYGIYCVILTPTRELAKQIHQQVLALGGPSYGVKSTLVVGGLDATKQATQLDSVLPHFCVATPGRLALLLRGPHPPRLQHARFLVLDEADRLLAPGSGFEKDVAELVLHVSRRRDHRSRCQTLLFSATMTRSLDCVEEMAGAGRGRLPLTKIVVDEGYDDGTSKKDGVKQPGENKAKSDDNDNDDEDDDDSRSSTSTSGSDEEDPVDTAAAADASRTIMTAMPKIPAGLKQEYVFMPSRVRDAYLLATLRALMENGGRHVNKGNKNAGAGAAALPTNNVTASGEHEDGTTSSGMARSAIVFVSTCERAAFVSELLGQVGVSNVALHSLLSQNRRLASLGKFKSQLVRVLVATDVASRGLDIPTVDLVVNAELPRSAVSYVHRVGRTVRLDELSHCLFDCCVRHSARPHHERLLFRRLGPGRPEGPRREPGGRVGHWSAARRRKNLGPTTGQVRGSQGRRRSPGAGRGGQGGAARQDEARRHWL